MRSLKRLNVAATPMTDVCRHHLRGRGGRLLRGRDLASVDTSRYRGPAAALTAETVADIQDQISYPPRQCCAHAPARSCRLHQAGTLFHFTIVVGLISLIGLGAGIGLIVSQAKDVDLSVGVASRQALSGSAVRVTRRHDHFASRPNQPQAGAKDAASLHRHLSSRTARIIEDAASSMLNNLGEDKPTYRKLLIPA
jgi:hypothetical protein